MKKLIVAGVIVAIIVLSFSIGFAEKSVKEITVNGIQVKQGMTLYEVASKFPDTFRWDPKLILEDGMVASLIDNNTPYIYILGFKFIKGQAIGTAKLTKITRNLMKKK
jgi:hypothetical protein